MITKNKSVLHNTVNEITVSQELKEIFNKAYYLERQLYVYKTTVENIKKRNLRIVVYAENLRQALLNAPRPTSATLGSEYMDWYLGARQIALRSQTVEDGEISE